MKENKTIAVIVAALNLVISLILLIFLQFQNVPLLVGIYDEVVYIGSKWWLLIGTILPVIFLIIGFIKNKKTLWTLFTEIIIIIAFENLLAFSYYYDRQSFVLGEISKISLSIAVFVPLSLAIIVYGAILKNIAYKSKFGFYSKNTTSTEFTWKQSHMLASRLMMLAGIILFLCSIGFIFLHLPLVELIIFVVFLLLIRIVVEIQASKMTKKYNDLNRLKKNKN